MAPRRVDGLVDFDRSDYQEALRHIPPRFHDLARQYAEEIAAKINAKYANDPALINNVRETTVSGALTGLSGMRWYLLFKLERAVAVEQAWRDGGVSGLCACMREIHQAERTLLVSGYGRECTEDAEARLSALHAKGCFTLVATTHGFVAGRVKEWAQRVGLSYLHFPLDSARDLDRQMTGQNFVLLDKLMPQAVCVITRDLLALRLAEYATLKRVPVISLPEARTAASAMSSAKPQVTAARVETQAPMDASLPRAFQFTTLMKGYTPDP